MESTMGHGEQEFRATWWKPCNQWKKVHLGMKVAKSFSGLKEEGQPLFSVGLFAQHGYDRLPYDNQHQSFVSSSFSDTCDWPVSHTSNIWGGMEEVVPCSHLGSRGGAPFTELTVSFPRKPLSMLKSVASSAGVAVSHPPHCAIELQLLSFESQIPE
jgi:hypothetical protein